MGKSVLIRVDGNAKIGMGHLTRCSVLLDELKRLGFGPFRYIIKDFPPAVEYVRKRSIAAEIIPAPIEPDKEADYIHKIAGDMKVSVIIFDLLELHDSFIERGCRDSALPVALFDLPQLPWLQRPLVFNHNVVWESSDQPTVHMENYFGGAEYVILNSIFSQMRSKYEFKPEVKRLFLNQGGGDPHNLTTKILATLLPLRDRLHIDVVLGGAFAFHEELAKVLTYWEGSYRLHQDISPDEVAELMASSQCAHTASGNMLYELMTIGVPSIAVSHHEKHEVVGEYFARKGAIAHLGIGTEMDEEAILEGTLAVLNDRQLRERFFTQGRKLVDGKGASRTAKKIHENI